MSATGSTSSRGTHSRSPSRSRSPPFNDGRYPPRFPSRYDSYSYRPRSGMTAAIDDYWELRDRERDRERERDRSKLAMRDDRYIRGRYSPYYRDEPPPPPPLHHYGPTNLPRDFGKPSSSTSLRREGSAERPLSISTKSKDDKTITTGDSYTSRYADWRERERDWDRDRRYRDDDRRREFDRRNRDRDGYSMRDSRYDSPGYTSGPPSASGYPPAPFGRDSYRPGGSSGVGPSRDREPSSPGGGYPYYDRDGRDRFEDRDFYRPMSRGSSIEFDRYRNRPSRPTPTTPTTASATGGASTIADRNSSGWRTTSRERDRERDSTGKLAYGTMAPTSSPSSKDDSKSTDTKLDDYDIGDRGSEYSIPVDDTKLEQPNTKLGLDSQVISSKENDGDKIKSADSPKAGENDDESVDQQDSLPSHRSVEKDDKNALQVDISPVNSLPSEAMEIDMPTLSSASPPASTRSATSAIFPPSASLSSEPIDTHITPTVSLTTPAAPISAPSDTTSSQSLLANSESLITATRTDAIKTEDTTESTTSLSTKVEIEDTSITKVSKPTPRQSPPSSTMDDSKENTEPSVSNQIKSETVLSQQQIVSRIDEIENDITMYESMLEQINKRETDTKHVIPQEQQQGYDDRQRQASVSVKLEPSSLLDTKLDTKDDDEDDDTEEEAAKKQALKVISEGSQPMTDIQNIPFNDSTIMRRRPQLLMDQIRTNGHNDEDALSAMIISDNQSLARENGIMMGGWQGKPDDGSDWSDETKWSAPLYDKVQDYPCYKKNIRQWNRLKAPMVSHMAYRRKQLKQKERRLKREFKEIYNQWKNKNMALDRMRAQERRGSDRYGGAGGGYRSSTRRSRGGGNVEEETEEYVDGVIFTGNHDALRFSEDGAMTPFGRGAWTSDAARSEAELLEIIQSLESAEMRNPELRAKKTTATIPPMILDVKERALTYDDRSGLVENPLVYYHTGSETDDVWTAQEMTTFMESYMQYPKQFEKVAAAVGTKTASQCVLFYYRKKTKIDFKALMRKGKRGKNRRRDRLAAAIKRATGDTSANARKGKSKGSALMADIGQAQVSRKAKEESETKTKELRELEEANTYWESVAERRKSKRPSSGSSATNRTTAGSEDGTIIGYSDTGMKRKPGKRKGRSPRPSTTSTPDTSLVYPDEPLDEIATKSIMKSGKLLQQVHQSQHRSAAATSTGAYVSGSMENNNNIGQTEVNIPNITTAKWTDKDKYAAVEAFKLLGRDFIKVSEKVGSKTDDQCRNFYFNHKRKYGPNAFGEEDGNYSGTPDTMSSPPASANKSVTANLSVTTDSPTSIPMTGSRPGGLKAEEEDAAAALVGLFQMGGNRDYSMDTTPSPSLSPSVSSPSVSLLASETTPGMHVSAQSKGRRRARTVSGKMDSTGTSEDWLAGDDSSLGSRGNSATTLVGKRNTSEVKRGTNSSYWSVSERGEFVHHLEMFGRDWARIANAMKTKTAIQVRNFYQNNEEKMQLNQVVYRREGGMQPIPATGLSTTAPYHTNSESEQQIMPPMGTSFDDHITSTTRLSSASMPPPPSSSATLDKSMDSPTYHTSSTATGPRSGYFNLSSSSSTRSTQSGSRDYATPYDTNTPSPYMTAYKGNPTTMHHPNSQQQYSAQSGSSEHNTMDMSPTGVTRVSDLLNSNDEPAETNNQNSWETWFGS